MRHIALVTTALLALAPAARAANSDDAHLAGARAALSAAPVIDGHNDIPHQVRQNYGAQLAHFNFARLPDAERAKVHTDIERLRAGGIGGAFWSVYVPADLPEPEALRQTIEQIDIVRRLVDANPQAMALTPRAADVERALKAKRIASLIGAEGGHSISNSLGVLRQLHQLGVGYMTLTHVKNTGWADSATDAPRHDGLTPFGVEVVREMNRLGMLVDLSHVAAATMHDALDAAQAPVIFSHSNAFAVTPYARNVPDDVLKRLPANGGVIMMTFIPIASSSDFGRWYTDQAAEKARLALLYPGDPKAVEAGMAAWNRAHPEVEATIAEVADHVDHVRKVAGIDHIGIGTDFDGLSYLPAGMKSADAFPKLFAELLKRGYSKQDLAKIANGNILRVMKRAEAVAARLQRERPASDMLFEAAAAR